MYKKCIEIGIKKIVHPHFVQSRFASESRPWNNSSFNQGGKYVSSLCNIKAENKLLRSHCTIEIPWLPSLRRNVTRGKASLLHPPSPSTTLSTPSESKIVHTAGRSYRSFPILETILANELTRELQPIGGCCGGNNTSHLSLSPSRFFVRIFVRKRRDFSLSLSIYPRN